MWVCQKQKENGKKKKKLWVWHVSNHHHTNRSSRFQEPFSSSFWSSCLVGVKKFLGKSDYLAVFYIQTNVAWQAERNLYIVLLFQHMSGVKDVTGVCFVHGPGDTLLAARSNNRSETVLYMLAQLVLFFPYAEMMYSLCSCSTQQSQISSCIHVVVI